MNKKMSIMIVLLIFLVSVARPYTESYGQNIKYSSNVIWENGDNAKIDNVCRCKSISPRVEPLSMNYMYFDLIIAQKDILSKEFESVIYDIKYRPQSARRNMTDEHTKFIPF